MKQKLNIDPEQAMKKVQEIFKERGTKALEMARMEILHEKIECREAKGALTYFMTQYWHDLARPSLLSLACEAVGGNPELTTPIAVPMILISGAIDIHDDIIDQSKMKDGRPTVYGKFGKDITLLVGDALLFKGLTLLNNAVDKVAPREKVPVVIETIKNMFFELGDAEALELELRKRVDITPEEYLQVVEKKGADVEAHTRISTILAGGTRDQIEALGRYGRVLGMLAILKDDWVDLLDLKESVQRLKKECLPLPLLYALQDESARAEIVKVIRKKALAQKDANKIFDSIVKAKGFKRARKTMDKLAEEATKYLRRAKCKKDYLALMLTSTLVSE